MLLEFLCFLDKKQEVTKHKKWDIENHTINYLNNIIILHFSIQYKRKNMHLIVKNFYLLIDRTTKNVFE